MSVTMLILASCGKTVTNYVAGENLSTPQAHTTTQGGSAQADSGGVINGGGGKGVRCTKDGKQTIEVLDLYEARTLYDLSLMNFGSSEDEAKEKLAQVLARHFWNPNSIEMNQYVKALKQAYIQEFLNNIRFIDSNKHLKLTNDSYEPTLEKGCEPVQIAMYYDESVLLVNKTLWSQMDWTNKMGLLAHEALYFLARQSGTTNSMSTRKLVGMLFSDKGVKPVADGVPTDHNKFLDCQLSSTGFSKGHFFLYKNQLTSGERGLEAVFLDLGNNGSLFRTSSFFEDLSFVQLQSPHFTGTRLASLIKDTYPTRDQVSLVFKGIKDGQLNAELRILRGTGTSVTDTLEVRCDLPSNFDDLEPKTTEPGEFEQKLGDGSVDKLTVNGNGGLILEETRQVGGTGGISNFGVVPYPTVCRYKKFGFINKQNEKEIQFTVISGELGSLEGLSDSDHCKDYIESFNRSAADGHMRFTIRKNEFTKINR